MVGRGTDAEAAVFQSRLWGPSPVHWEALLNDTRRMAFGPHLGRASHPYHDRFASMVDPNPHFLSPRSELVDPPFPIYYLPSLFPWLNLKD